MPTIESDAVHGCKWGLFDYPTGTVVRVMTFDPRSQRKDYAEFWMVVSDSESGRKRLLNLNKGHITYDFLSDMYRDPKKGFMQSADILPPGTKINLTL